MNKRHAADRQVGRPLNVDSGRRFGIVFRFVHRRIGRAVDHRLITFGIDHQPHRLRVGYVKQVAVGIIGLVAEQPFQFAAELAVASGY